MPKTKKHIGGRAMERFQEKWLVHLLFAATNSAPASVDRLALAMLVTAC